MSHAGKRTFQQAVDFCFLCSERISYAIDKLRTDSVVNDEQDMVRVTTHAAGACASLTGSVRLSSSVEKCEGDHCPPCPGRPESAGAAPDRSPRKLNAFHSHLPCGRQGETRSNLRLRHDAQAKRSDGHYSLLRPE